MKRLLAPALALLLASPAPARADDTDVKAVVDKAVKALGGEEALARAGAFSYTTRSLRRVREGSPNEVVTRTTVQGIERHRTEAFAPGPVVEGDRAESLNVSDGDRGWLEVRGQVRELNAQLVASYRLLTATDAASVNLAPLRDGSSKVEASGEEAVDGRPAVGLKVTRPEGTFTLYFDKESGLPVRWKSRVILQTGSPGRDYSMTYHDYKDFGGLKVATRRLWSSIQGGEQKGNLVMDLTDFKALDKVDPATFAKPE